MTPISMIALGSVLAIIGAAISLVGTYRHNTASSEKSSLILENTNTLTGAGNVPIMFVDIYKPYKGANFFSVDFTLTNNGKYPLRNVVFTMSDMYGGVKEIISEEGNKIVFELKDGGKLNNSVIRDIGDIVPNDHATVYNTTMVDEQDDTNISFKVQWSDRFYRSYIKGSFNKDRTEYIIEGHPTTTDNKNDSIDAVKIMKHQ